MALLPTGLFSSDYPAARRRFRAACEVRGARASCTVHPQRGPDGGELAIDCAWLGSPDAERVLVLSSGTHGVEGLAGSGPQLDLMLGDWARVPEGTAVLLIHALNPWGYAWMRRTTEEGVDLNRNFVDFAKPLPENPGYSEIADDLVPATASPAALAAAEARLAEYRRVHGDEAYLVARGSGQYTHPGGLFYGGAAPTWARRASERLIAEFGLPARRAVAVIDLHSGLGPYGYGELICAHAPDSAGARRGARWYGPTWKEPQRGTSITVPLVGLSQQGWEAAIGPTLTFAYLEFGTLPPEAMQRALARDHELHNRGPVDWRDPQTQDVKREMLEAYAPSAADWRETVLFRCRQVVCHALAGLQTQ
jgi:hypothetical protein